MGELHGKIESFCKKFDKNAHYLVVLYAKCKLKPQSPPRRRPHFCPPAASTQLLYWRLLDWVYRKNMASSSSVGSYLRLVLPWRIAAWIWFIASTRERRWLWRQFLTMQPRPRIAKRMATDSIATSRSVTIFNFSCMLERPYIELFQGFSSSSSLTLSPEKRGREEAAKYGLYHIVYTITAAAAKEEGL